MPHDPLPSLSDTRFRLLDAALAEHATLSAALGAAQEAEAWLRGGDDPAPLLALPAPAAAPEPSPEIGRDTRSPRRPRQPRPAVAEEGAAPLKRDKAWIEPTLAAVAALERAGDAVTRSSLARRLDIPPAAASWRLRHLAAMGKLAMIGARTRTSYRAAGEAPPADPEPIRPAPIAASPVRPQPRPEPPPPRPAPASAVLVSVDRVAPPAAAEFVSIETVVRYLRSRGFVITGGAGQFQVDLRWRDADWLVERANRDREPRGQPAFVVRA